jgi:hypothetical protein
MKPILKALAAVSLSALLPALAVAQDYDDEGDISAPAPAAESPPAPEPSVPAGEWVNTEQYGWVWMPYGDDYTSVPADGYGAPYMYVYYPSYGWTWLAAPWVWGLGPWPVFGIYGPVHFGWWGHGWWRTPDRWHWTGGDFHRGFVPGGHWRDGGGRTFPGSGRMSPAFRGGGGFRTGGGVRTAPGFGGRTSFSPGVRSAYPSGGRTSFSPGVRSAYPSGGRSSFSPGGRSSFPSGGRTFMGGTGGRGSFSGGGGAIRGGHAPSGGGVSRSMPGGGHVRGGR